MTSVVAILAHPDDAEILAGGTLYKHLQRGDSVGICSVTYTPDSVRGQEGAAGAQRLGAEFTCLGLQDMGVSRYTPADVERLTAFFLARPPDLVLRIGSRIHTQTTWPACGWSSRCSCTMRWRTG